jgi:hypothetical protein
MKCDYCDKEIREEGCRILCTNKKDFKVKIYYYCSQCFQELSSEYKKRYGEGAIIEQ